MVSCYFSYRDSQIHYLRAGQGPRWLFFFHGYGESGASFQSAAEYLSGDFTIICIDLPHHGKTHWTEGIEFQPGDLLAIMEGIAGKPIAGDEKLTLVGYSMGGRIALAMLPHLPGKVSRLILLAPDGLKVNPWYRLATHTWPGKHLFRFTMDRPGWFLGVLKLADRLGLVNQSIYKFAISYLHNKQQRRELYERWMTMRRFRPSAKKIKQLLSKEKISLDLVYGRYDRIIRHETGEKFIRDLESRSALLILQAGHQLLQARYLEQIIPLFKSR